MSYDFNGSNNYMHWGALTTFDSLTTMSISAWVHPDTTASDGIIFSNRPSGSFQGFSLEVDASGFFSSRTNIISCAMDDGDTAIQIEGANNSAQTTNWQHCGVSFLGNDSNGMRLYIDGVEDANSPITSVNCNNTGTAGANTTTGGSGSGDYLNGRTGLIAVWDEVLSANDFVALAAGASPLLIRPGALKFYAPLLSSGEDLIGGVTATLVNSPSVNTSQPPYIAYPSVLHPSVDSGGVNITISVPMGGTPY